MHKENFIEIKFLISFNPSCLFVTDTKWHKELNLINTQKLKSNFMLNKLTLDSNLFLYAVYRKA